MNPANYLYDGEDLFEEAGGPLKPSFGLSGDPIRLNAVEGSRPFAKYGSHTPVNPHSPATSF
jgi:hypothetical protein